MGWEDLSQNPIYASQPFFLQKGRHLLLDGKESLSGDDPKEVATVGTI